MDFLNLDAILNADDIKTEEVEVPEWGGKVLVKGMSGTERDSFEASMIENAGTKNPKLKMENIRAKLLLKTVIDPETKKPLFTAAHLDQLGQKSAAAIDRIYSVAQRLSKISDEDVEELTKN